jgi:hypothetical protein
MRHARGWFLPVAGALLLAACAPAPAAPPRRNVVLISLDTLRADRMSLYGAARATTPAIDRLAASGVAFTSAYSPSPWTLPAHAAMLTGRYPSALSRDPEDPLYTLAPTLAAVLGAQGWATAAVTGGAFVSAAFGADRGFDTFAEGTVDDAVARLEALAPDPFFLFFHTYAAHMPYSDRRFVRDGEGERLADLYRGSQPEWEPLHLRLCCTGFVPTAAEHDFLLRLYDGGVAAADEMVAALVAALHRLDVFDETIVIVTSDHGEEFWDHTGRAAYHGHTLYRELLRIPLVWFETGLRDAGQRRGEDVHLVDVVPTVLARLGVPAPSALDGVDLSPLLDGGPWSDDRTLFGESIRYGPRRYSARDRNGTLILTPHPTAQRLETGTLPLPIARRRELFTPDDSGEHHERQHALPALAADLTRRLHAHRHAAATPVHGADDQIDAATHERLRTLGYVR